MRNYSNPSKILFGLCLLSRHTLLSLLGLNHLLVLVYLSVQGLHMNRTDCDKSYLAADKLNSFSMNLIHSWACCALNLARIHLRILVGLLTGTEVCKSFQQVPSSSRSVGVAHAHNVVSELSVCLLLASALQVRKGNLSSYCRKTRPMTVECGTK